MKLRTAIMLTCILTALVGTVSAQAMTSKIDQTLKVTTAGVQASGPITGWEADEASAVVTVRITQGNKSDTGTTRSYTNGAQSWSTLATGDKLSPGAAVGHATALVKLTNGTTETYSWTVSVTLVK